MKNKIKRIAVPVLLILVAGVMTIIVYKFTSEDVSSGISFFCSLLSIILSVVALWYTFKSGDSIDAQFSKMEKLIKEMRTVQHELDISINNTPEDILPQELKEKLNDFKDNLESDDFSLY